MKSKLKLITIALIIIVLLLVSGVALADTYETLDDGRSLRVWSATIKEPSGNKVYIKDMKENANNVVTEINDNGKAMAKLNGNQLHYVARDIAYYKNLYCVAYGQNLDNSVFRHYKTTSGVHQGTGGVTFYATHKAVIEGNKCSFYRWDVNGSKWIGLNDNGTAPSFKDNYNNILAGILTEPNPAKLMSYTGTYSKELAYKGNGASTVTEGHENDYKRYSNTYTFTQFALWKEYNEWVKAVVANGIAEPGFSEGAKNSNAMIQENKAADYNDFLDKNYYASKLVESGNTYYATIYFLETDRENIEAAQNLILVKPGEVKTQIKVTKEWEDNNNAARSRPTQIWVSLYQNGKLIDGDGMSESDGVWSYEFTDLPKYDADGNEYVYTVKEDAVPGYTSSGEGNKGNGYTITNTLIEKTSITMEKTWSDSNNPERATSIWVMLKRKTQKDTGYTIVGSMTQIKSSQNWTYTWQDLPRYDNNGNEYTYIVEEKPVAGYTSSGEGNKGNEFTITNTLETIDIPVQKVWEDNENSDGIRPTSITITLYKNGTIAGKTLTLKESNSWKGAFTGLPKYDANGNVITYTIQEVSVDGYISKTDGDVNSGFIITNTETIDIKLKKDWEDNNNSKGIRPSLVKVKVSAKNENGESIEVSGIEGLIQINKLLDWSTTVTGLPKYYKDGENWKKIIYDVEEVTSNTLKDDYICEITKVEENQTITFTITNTETIDIPVTKQWEDNGVRPNKITINLTGNYTDGGNEVGTTIAVELSPDIDGNWSYTFENLPKYKNGKEIIYTVTEAPLEGYSVDIQKDANGGFIITNTADTNITVTKVWKDNNIDENRPEITVTLYAKTATNTENKKVQIEGIENPVTLSIGNWSHTFTDLPKFDSNGDEYIYTVMEDDVPEGYISSGTADKDNEFTITNTEVIDIPVTKVWDDNENENGVRPDHITVQLYKQIENGNKEKVDEKEINEQDGWTYTFTNLPKYENGKLIAYSVEEEIPQGYVANIQEDGVGGFTITNTSTDYMNIPVTKVWEDNNNVDGVRTDHITVQLYKQIENGNKEKVDEKQLNEQNGWTYTFENLPLYQNGEPIKYSVQELQVDRYSTEISKIGSEGITITNTLLFDIPVTKVWEDNSNAEGIRPASIEVTLYKKESVIETVTLNKDNSWSYTFENLPKYENGNLIEYIVKETVPEGYIVNTQYDNNGGVTLTNTAVINIPVTKVWEDNNNVDGIRPTLITVTLYKNGEKTEKTVTLNQDNSWSYTFENLPKYDENEQEITYSVEEEVPSGYDANIQQDGAGGFIITNTEVIDIPVTKVWEDKDNANGIRPTQITINLIADDTEIGVKAIQLNADNNWSYTFKNLPKYKDGKEIIYSVTEEPLEEYIDNVEKDANGGFIITNTEVIDIPVTKVWEDNDNADGIRPTSITITLYKNGEKTEKTLTLNESNSWKDTFLDLPKYDENEQEITYTVQEEEIEKYISKTDGDVNSGFIITNIQVIDIPVTKVWEDNNNEEGIRPTSIIVTLYQDGEKTEETLTIEAAKEWKGMFKNLPKYKGNHEIIYTIQEEKLNGYIVEIKKEDNGEFIITNIADYDGYIEISGKVWEDKLNGKANEINGEFDDGYESGLEGIQVVLKDKDGKQFDATSTAITNRNGEYTIKVNYDNSKKVYKLYEDAETVREKLATSYVEFEYDAMEYTTVKVKEITDANTSKAIENETERNLFDKKYQTVNPDTDIAAIEKEMLTANTQNIIDFSTYSAKVDRDTTITLKYCNGNGTYIQTNTKGAHFNILEGECNPTSHPEICSGQGHKLKQYDVVVTEYKNINLGLVKREQPDVRIFSDITKVEVAMKNQQYTYVYGARSEELEAASGPLIKYQDKDKYGTYTYTRPVNPADIAYINSEVAAGNEMQVKVTYQVKLANLSKTLPVTVHNIKNYYDSRYTLDTTGWDITAAEGYNTATPYKDINVLLQPGAESEAIELTYTVSVETIKGLLRKQAGLAALNNVVEIQSYSTAYGENTIYAEQRTGGRTGNPYAGYDYDSHPGNAGVHLNEQGVLEVTKLEDDTDIAPSFKLTLDERYYKILSGNVWEDSDANAGDGYRLGDGKKANTENNVANVKAELYRVKDDGTLEIAKLYSIAYNGSEVAEIKTKDAIAYTNSEGYYAFGDGNYSVVTDNYIIKFTYGTGIDGTISSSINGVNISARDYKSTIISKDTEINELNKGYSIAVDNIEQRVAISDLQYSNFNNGFNITATSKPFAMKLEFSPEDIKESKVGADGYTTYGNESNIFDFGIIERAREDIFVNTTMNYLKITLANGQVLTEGNPQVDDMNYAKLVGFQQNINSGSAARRAVEKQLIMEMDTELIQGAQLEVRYQISVTNNSEKDIDYYVDNQYKTEFYYFGTNNENSPEITESVNKVITYMDAELTYKWENDSQWTQVSANELKDQGYISEATYNAIANNDYLIYVTNTANNLKPGQTNNYFVTARKLLANTDENSYDIQAEILEIDAKTARTTNGKQYKMGNYVPSLEARVINTDINLERAGLHEQDDDRLKIVITPPTGDTKYIMNYIITGLISLIVIGVTVMFIKKKVLK